MCPSKLTAQGEHFQTCPAFLNSFISSDWILSPEYFHNISITENNRNTPVALTDHIRAVLGTLWTKSFTSEETAL